MVGVCFWVFNTIFAISVCLAKLETKVKECPEICICLGFYVDCSSKKLENIPTIVPNWATHLNLQNNSIRKLSDVDWRHFMELKELILNKNNIGTIPKNAFQHQTQLKILELNRNKLKVIEALTFKSLVKLRTLKLKRNQISELKDGAFYGLKSIDKLILDYNNLRVISKSWLYGLEALKELSLSHNFIGRIEYDAWTFCQTLLSLDLSYNNLGSVEVDTFKNLEHLQKLSLNNNNITVIKENAFNYLPRLKILNLSNNRISYTIEDSSGIYQGLNDLMKFYLSGNRIKSINAEALIGLKNVTYLNLSNNNITSIQRNAFSELPFLQDLVMNTSSLMCDCNLRWFLDWLNLKQLKIEMVICAYPEGLQGESLLKVESNLTCDELPIPRLIEQPDPAIMALKGENVTLSCKAVSNSPETMIFIWKKDNVVLTNSNIVVTSRIDDDGKTTETNSNLNLIKIDHIHAGKYQCIVFNSLGKVYSQKSSISVLVYPTFQKIPKNVTVKTGETVKWECAASGEPQPEIAWHKDGGNDFPAARERRMQVMPHDDVFFIMSVKPSDMGIYSCTAHNPAGTVVANASLTIEEKPSFIKEMVDKEFTAGEHVVLQGLARGVPKPTISWFKDGEAIIPTERHFFIHENQMVIIVDSVQSDSGVYECRLNNSLGEEIGQSRIIVKPNTYYNRNMLGIIIISVVCCAVLTSIIWVFIIYHTRGRMASQVIQDNSPISRSRSHQLQLQVCPDDVSEHSSCKDSGTGDSAKRSSDDLAPEEFTMILAKETTTIANPNHSHMPLLHNSSLTSHQRNPSVSSLSTPAKDV